MTVLEQVEKYLALELSAIPIAPNSKRPTVNWKPYQTRRMTPAEAKMLFKPDSNIAIVTGAISGISVLDVDDYKKDGGITFTSPLSVTTPHGGHHEYAKYSPGRNTANASIATDMRIDGGYVLAPGSVIDGKPYVWSQEPTPEILRALPEIPQDILDKVYKLNTTNGHSNGVFKPADAIGLGDGERNNGLSPLCLSLLNKYRDNPERAWKELKDFAATANPPYPEYELRLMFNAKLRYFQQNPPVHKIVENSEFKLTSFGDDLEKAAATIDEGLVKGIPSGYPSLDAITGGYIPGQSTLAYADTNVGKSVFITGSLVYMAEHGVKSVYFDLENSMTETVARLALIAHHGDITSMDWKLAVEAKTHRQYLEKLKKLSLYVWDLTKLTDRFGEITWEGVRKCIEEAVAEGAKVVVIDHLHYFAPAETDHGKLADIARQINILAADNNIAIILVAHTKKGLVQEKKGRVVASRPTIDSIMGSGLIAKHTKTAFAIQRNTASEDPIERTETTVWVDKTKAGPGGHFSCKFNEQTLQFQDVPYDTDPFAEKSAGAAVSGERKVADMSEQEILAIFEEPADGSEPDIKW